MQGFPVFPNQGIDTSPEDRSFGRQDLFGPPAESLCDGYPTDHVFVAEAGCNDQHEVFGQIREQERGRRGSGDRVDILGWTGREGPLIGRLDKRQEGGK